MHTDYYRNTDIVQLLYIHGLCWCDSAISTVLNAEHPSFLTDACTGPFVMNMRDQVTEAITDYSQGRNGFEQAQKNAV